MRRQNARLVLLLLFVLVTSPLACAQEAPLGGFDHYFNKALRDWEVPGVAIAVLKDDRIVELAAVAPARFRIVGAPEGFFAQSEMDAGKPKSLTLVQGAGTSFVLTPKP